MADIERKIIVDTSDIDKAKKESAELTDEFEKGQKKQTRVVKKGVSKRIQAIRDGISRQLREVRAGMQFRIIEIRKALRRNELTEQQAADNIVAIQRKAAAQISNIKIKAGTKQQTKNLEKRAGIFSRIGKIFKGGLIAGAIGLASRALFSFGKSALDAGAKLEAIDKRARVVFGDAFPQMQREARKTAVAMGFTTNEFLGAAGAIADLLIPIGATRDQAAEMSAETIKLAAALKEFNGDTRSASEVANVLTKAFLGEREGLKSLGISITEADIKTEMLRRGTSKLTGEALQLEKAIITQELITRKGADALESYASGASGAARQQASFTATVNEFSEEGLSLISEFFKPFQRVIGAVFSALTKAIRKLKEFFNIADINTKKQLDFSKSLIRAGRTITELGNKTTKTLKEQKKLVNAYSVLQAKLTELNWTSNLQNLTYKEQINVIGQLKVAEKERVKDQLANAERNLAAIIKQRELLGVKPGDIVQQFGFTDEDLANAQKNIRLLKATSLELLETFKVPIIPEIIPKFNFKKLEAGKKKASLKVDDLLPKSTTEQALLREQEYINNRLEKIKAGTENELLLERGLEIEKDLIDIRELSRIAELETEREQLKAAELERLLELEREFQREKDKLRRKELSKINKEKSQEFKEKITQTKREIGFEQKKLAVNAKLRQKHAERVNKLAEFVFDFGQSLLSEEKGSFKKFLADQLRSLTNYLSAKLLAEAAAAIANPPLAAALALAAGGVKLLGEAGARALERDAETPVREPQIPRVQDIVKEPEAIPAGMKEVTINNIDNSINLEVIETGTYFTESQLIRDRIKPMMDELNAERGVITFE